MADFGEQEVQDDKFQGRRTTMYSLLSEDECQGALSYRLYTITEHRKGLSTRVSSGSVTKQASTGQICKIQRRMEKKGGETPRAMKQRQKALRSKVGNRKGRTATRQVGVPMRT